jgi:hypothetical protein
MVAAYTGTRLPWLRTDISFFVRIYVLFPALSAGFFWCLFIAKTADGRTPFRTLISDVRGKPAQIRKTASLVAGSLFLPFFLADISYVAPAWLAKMVAKDPYAQVFRLSELKERSGPLWTLYYEIYLGDSSTGAQATLPFDASSVKEKTWRQGEMVCVRGTTSIFGTIVTSMQRDIDHCRHPVPMDK